MEERKIPESQIIPSNELKRPSPETGVTLTELKPDVVDFFQIEDSVEGKEPFVVIFGIYLSRNGDIRSVLKKKEYFTFNVNFAVSPLLVDLKAEYVLHLIVIDLKSNNPQLFYNRALRARLQHRYFRISFKAQANLSGTYRLRAIAQLKDSGLFHILEGRCFRVM